jgi:hypothetical protein
MGRCDAAYLQTCQRHPAPAGAVRAPRRAPPPKPGTIVTMLVNEGSASVAPRLSSSVPTNPSIGVVNTDVNNDVDPFDAHVWCMVWGAAIARQQPERRARKPNNPLQQTRTQYICVQTSARVGRISSPDLVLLKQARAPIIGGILQALKFDSELLHRVTFRPYLFCSFASVSYARRYLASL